MRTFSLALIAATAMVNASNPYQDNGGSFTWAQAYSHCMRRGQYLARVLNSYQNRQLMQAAPRAGWIGGTNANNRDYTWDWAGLRHVYGKKNGVNSFEKRFTYTNWSHNYPGRVNGNNCVRIMPNGTWKNMPCAMKLRAVCMWRPQHEVREEARLMAAKRARARAQRAAKRARIAKAKAVRLAREAKARATRIAKARAIRAAAAARIAKAKAIRDARIAKAKALAAHRRRIKAAHQRRIRVANAKHYRHHNNIFNRNIRSSKTWYSYIRSNTAHFRHTSAMRAHRNKMVAKYFAARNHAGRWASIRNRRWAVARKNRGVMNKTRKTATWWSRHVANMNRIRIAKSKYHTAMRNKQRSHARWGVAHVRNAQRQRSSWNRKWAGVVARASKANRAALIAYHKANAQKSKAWKGYHASHASYMRHLKAYRLSVKNLGSAQSKKAYWLKKARVSHHKLVSYVRSGHGKGYFH